MFIIYIVMIISLLYLKTILYKREVTVDLYSETVSSNVSSDDRTITADSDSSAASSFEETPCKWETDSKELKLPFIK